MPSKYDFPVGVMGATAAAVLYTLDYFIGPEHTKRSDIIRFLQNVAQMFLFLAVSYAVVRIAIVLTDRRKKNPRRSRRSRRSNRPSRIVHDPSELPAPHNPNPANPNTSKPNTPNQPAAKNAPLVDRKF